MIQKFLNKSFVHKGITQKTSLLCKSIDEETGMLYGTFITVIYSVHIINQN